MQICFIDTETTGLYPSFGDRICELALIKTDAELNILDEFDSLINPQREISPEAFQVNRIERSVLKGAPLFANLIDDLTHFLRDCYLAGHNVAFDESFLRNEFRLAGQEYLADFTLDSRQVAKSLVQLPSYGLSALTGHYKITVKNRHRAMGDCRATLQLFRELARHYQSLKGGTVEDFIREYARKTECIPVDVPNWLAQAMAENREVAIEYNNRENQISRRRIKPLSIFTDRGRTYLEAFCSLRQTKLTFLLDRIKKIDYSV